MFDLVIRNEIESFAIWNWFQDYLMTPTIRRLISCCIIDKFSDFLGEILTRTDFPIRETGSWQQVLHC